MGGFVLLHTAPGEDRSAARAAALGTFARMGMPAPRLIEGVLRDAVPVAAAAAARSATATSTTMRERGMEVSLRRQ